MQRDTPGCSLPCCQERCHSAECIAPGGALDSLRGAGRWGSGAAAGCVPSCGYSACLSCPWPCDSLLYEHGFAAQEAALWCALLVLAWCVGFRGAQCSSAGWEGMQELRNLLCSLQRRLVHLVWSSWRWTASPGCRRGWRRGRRCPGSCVDGRHRGCRCCNLGWRGLSPSLLLLLWLLLLLLARLLCLLLLLLPRAPGLGSGRLHSTLLLVGVTPH